jgi:ribokinase
VLLQHCHTVVSTMGKQGARAVCSNGEKVQAPACAVPVVDTVGAGDFFCGAFLAAHMHGLPLGACLSAGCAAGAQVVQTSGAQLSEGNWQGLRRTFHSLVGA